MSLLLTLNFPIPYLSVSFVDFEPVTTSWVNKKNLYNTPLLNTCSRCILVQTLYGTISNRCYMESAPLSEGRRLLEVGAYFDEAWHLLEELRYSSIKPV